MPEYRRYFVPGGTYFFTIVTYRRRRLFADEANLERLRSALREVKAEMPFHIQAAVVLPDHMHFIWTLPPGDDQYSKRIGLMKVKFTLSLRGRNALPDNVSPSRRKHRESDVWQRRFWEHTIDEEDEFESYFDYIHYNPVKHRYVSCPHKWRPSSFHRWVRAGVYENTWACCCGKRKPAALDFSDIQDNTGE
ncbi:MAG: transposase [Planctomycetes bacterium]|nr:transposase [Planctomycetota bacterium]